MFTRVLKGKIPFMNKSELVQKFLKNFKGKYSFHEYKADIVIFQAKEIYHTRCLELEKLKRTSASEKDIEKVCFEFKKN